MLLKYSAHAAIFILFLLTVTAVAQDSTAVSDKSNADLSDESSITKTNNDSNSTETGNVDSSRKYRFAKPKLNFLIGAVWERSQEVIGQDLKEYEREFLISPGMRWAYIFKNGLIVSPGVAVPIGIGPSRGENGIFFYISFEHSFRRAS
jgi:hypothetical protein